MKRIIIILAISVAVTLCVVTTWAGGPIGHVYDAVAGSLNSLTQTTTTGEATTLTKTTESVTFAADPGAATATTTGSIIPDGCFLIGLSYRVTTVGTNCAGFDIGVSGVGGDTDLFGNDIAVAAGTTGTVANWTANISNPQYDGPFEVVVTGTNGAGVATNCFGMVVAITSSCWMTTAATGS